MDGKNKVSLQETILQFLKFGAVGVSNTLIAFGVYYFLFFNNVHYMVANLAGWAVGVFNGFYWNNKYVFKSSGDFLGILLKTYMSYGVSFLTGMFMLYVLVEFLHMSPVIAPVLCLLVTVPLNFMLNKFWAFK